MPSIILGNLDGIFMAPGDQYTIPAHCLNLQSGGPFIACDAAASGFARMTYEIL